MKHLKLFENFDTFESFVRELSKYVDVEILIQNKEVLKNFYDSIDDKVSIDDFCQYLKKEVRNLYKFFSTRDLLVKNSLEEVIKKFKFT